MSKYDEINSLYDLKSLCDFLNSNITIVKIGFQFNKNNLKYASLIQEYLDLNIIENSNKFYFFLGESSYGECCVDEVTAKHLNPDVIIRVGDSCMTKTKDLKVYYLPEKRRLSEKIIEEISNILITEAQSLTSRLFFYYDSSYYSNFNQLDKLKAEKNLLLPLNTSNTTNEMTNILEITNKSYMVNKENPELNIDDRLIILNIVNEFGNEAYSYELIMKYSKLCSIKCISVKIDENQALLENFDISMSNKLFTNRFNLSLKAKESQTFGILIGNLNISSINNILLKIKKLLHKNNKKYYTFLLGKITDDKLANYVEYIDCFILVACTCNSFISRKACMKPIICPIDLLFAFNEKQWDMTYSFDPNYFVNIDSELNQKYMQIDKLNNDIQSEALALIDKDEKKALSLVFSNNIITHFEERKFKGIEINKDKSYSKEIRKGKKGLPIKYENIDQIK